MGREPAGHSQNQASLAEIAQSENRARHLHTDLSRVVNFHGTWRVALL